MVSMHLMYSWKFLVLLKRQLAVLSYDRRDKSKLITEVPLLSCNKDMENHKSLWSFAGVNGEQELILLRAGIFNTQQDVSAFTICPFHRSELGIGWRKSSSTCKVPHEIVYHSKGKTSKEDAKLSVCIERIQNRDRMCHLLPQLKKETEP